MARRKFQIAFLVCLLSVGLVACTATFTRDAYRTLAVSQQTYDGTLSALGDMYKQGLVNEATKDKAIELGRFYKAAHNEAVAALLAYETNPTPDGKKKYLDLAADASKRLADLITFAKPFLTGGK